MMTERMNPHKSSTEIVDTLIDTLDAKMEINASLHIKICHHVTMDHSVTSKNVDLIIKLLMLKERMAFADSTTQEMDADPKMVKDACIYTRICLHAEMVKSVIREGVISTIRSTW